MRFYKTVEPGGEITYHTNDDVTATEFEQLTQFNADDDNTRLHAWIEANCEVVPSPEGNQP